MTRPSIAFVVGHSNWGKSRTLRSLTGGNPHQKRTHIRDVEFFIRRMSNDDVPEGFKKRMLSIDPAHWPYIIAALCPNFEDERVATQTILERLRDKGYQLFFWVMEQKYGSKDIVAPSDIARLGRFGTVEVVTKIAEADERARKFKAFISNVVLA